MKEWIPFFKRLLAFVFGLGVILASLNYWISGKYETYIRYKFSELIHPVENADTIIIGSSRGMCSFNPKGLEPVLPSLYNFGMLGFPGNREFYDNFIKKYYRKPRLILCSVEMRTFVG